MQVLKPDTEDQVAEAVRDARSGLALEGQGTKQGFGRATNADAVLRLAGLTGITMYEPDEMVFTARAGTPLAEIEDALAAKGQCLGFEPADVAPLWGREAGATIGGTIAAAIAGPRRFAAGAARDHLLGFVAINGKGERFKSGGRVVKNVTGYDLSKLAAGSFGTLFAMTEVTLRALPRATATSVLAFDAAEPEQALRTLRAAAASPFEPAGLTLLSAAVAERVLGKAQATALIRIEGDPEGVAARTTEIEQTVAKGARILETDEGRNAFAAVAALHACFPPDGALWRVSLPPSRANEALGKLSPKSWIADGAGGLLWADEPSGAVHDIARELGGHATCYRRGESRQDDIFPPLDAATGVLVQQIKAAFDPRRTLSPGRMYKDV